MPFRIIRDIQAAETGFQPDPPRAVALKYLEWLKREIALAEKYLADLPPEPKKPAK